MMKVIRLTRVVEIIRSWEFVSTRLSELAQRSGDPIDLEYIRKTLFWMVVDMKNSWVGLVMEDGEPVAFAAAQDCTPPFQDERQFVVRWFVHSPGFFKATLALEQAFLTWAKENGVAKYAITTKRDSGAAIRCLMSQKYGFQKGYLTFEKKI
jgi:hypothetical protein